MLKSLPREILFRAKRLGDGKWLEGCLDYHLVTKLAFIRVARHRYTDVDMVLPETVGQFTGLIDKNRKKIFEGDVVRHLNDSPYADDSIREIGEVYWDDSYCGWRRTSNGAFHHGVVDTYRLSPECCYEVVGNIYDNPELLGGADNG